MNNIIIKDLFSENIIIDNNLIEMNSSTTYPENQEQTKNVFSKKWSDYENSKEKEKLYKMQKNWYLDLYGFNNEDELARFLRKKKIIFDAGCGLGYKSAWFAGLSSESIVIGMDISDSVYSAAKNYQYLSNLFFIKSNIAETKIKSEAIDYVSCDQVLQHTEHPEETINELARILSADGELALYVYRKKALPRELLDDYFRSKCKELSHNELLDLSKQLTELGKILSELKAEIEVPEIPALEIKGGKYDIQRFIYWNFLKCFWNEELGYDTSVSTNYDWYSPSNARRFTKNEFLDMIKNNDLNVIYLHEEEACYSGRFKK